MRWPFSPGSPGSPGGGFLRRLGPAVRWTAGALALVVVLPLIAALVFLRGMYSGPIDAQAHSRGRDAVWLGHAWVDGRHDETDLAALAARIEGTGIRDVYVHTGPMEDDGTLPPERHPRADWLLTAMAERLPRVRVQAWIGNRLAYGDDTSGLRLADPDDRAGVVATAGRMLDLGFDGVHLNVEAIASGDQDYLRLLDALAAQVGGRGGVLSVSAHQIDPLPRMDSVVSAVTGKHKWWSQRYFGQVARRVDQIAVMSYDGQTPVESLYGGYVAQQTELALQVTPEDTELLMGLPFFHNGDLIHRAETVRAAVRGVRLGLTREDPRRAAFGVALYVDYAATADDWRTYRRHWGGTG
ncbi:hypothetical protein [Streptomyces aidingensis]|uniref:Glycosyl hydrolases family 18 n=1 Tax=Streptomyces aidingensis TaxID=910347 RepID=A0A1I1S039_9ACTN|nr:hypothetical protein [Streptomyces aidingensis]SFD39934.1 Glycosyl hydrolases family 18 [Streptomyces aidingensis]